jgi:hypothetical protein
MRGVNRQYGCGGCFGQRGVRLSTATTSGVKYNTILYWSYNISGCYKQQWDQGGQDTMTMV